ncbi:MAG: AraC family transcriptional regulator [Ruminococcus sp.]|nr:AraC family transcriptional regulator [Ruminococcus sp.]MDE7097791.1 AraC family transcriptional regulator [Ruminococcus sp.]
MKVTKIIINNKKTESVQNTSMQDCCLYLFRNSVIFNINGTEKTYNRNTVIIYKSGANQSFKSPVGKWLKYDMVCFHLSLADKQYIADMDIPFNTPVSVPDDFIIASAIKSMKIHSDISGNRETEFAELYMRIILIAVEDAYSGIKLEKNNIPKYPKLKELQNSIYNNPFNDWTVDKVCRQLSISKTYFHRIYSETFGTTFMQDVIESRLIYASELLLNTDLSVSAIAEKCGYESDSYFMRQFRTHRGCTPTEYRKRKQSKSNE